VQAHPLQGRAHTDPIRLPLLRLCAAIRPLLSPPLTSFHSRTRSWKPRLILSTPATVDSDLSTQRQQPAISQPSIDLHSRLTPHLTTPLLGERRPRRQDAIRGAEHALPVAARLRRRQLPHPPHLPRRAGPGGGGGGAQRVARGNGGVGGLRRGRRVLVARPVGAHRPLGGTRPQARPPGGFTPYLSFSGP